MNLRPPRPERCALPAALPFRSCGHTKRVFKCIAWDASLALRDAIGKHHSQHGRQMRDPSEVEQLHRRARRSRFVHAVCDDLNCPLRSEVALAEICKSKTLISFAVGAPVEVAQPFGLQAIGDHAVEQMARQVIGGLAAEHRMPSCPQATEIEIAQMRDLVLQFAH